MRRRLILPILPLAIGTAAAQVTPPAPSLTVQPLPVDDGRAYGHFAYVDVGAGALVSTPAGFALGQPCRLHPGAAAAVAGLIAAQQASGVPGELRGLSCYRSAAHQQAVFCRRGRACADAERRSRLVAPPGHSEHQTGYALDFAVRPAPGCPDTSDCIAATPAGRWLLANAGRFGFELSFPHGNAQGVSWEPWHWRWVGVDGEDPAAATARRLFAPARARFPAAPAVAPLVVRVAAQPPVPLTTLPAPTPPPRVKLRKPPRRRR